jgi:hypothetical protein
VRIALATVLGALLLAGVASAANKPQAVRWIDKDDGFSIVLPPKWYAVPRSPTQIQQLIAQLKKNKKTDLATAYGFYLTPNGKSELKAYRFQAFYFNGPSTDPVPISVSVQVVPGKHAYTAADLVAAARAYGGSLASAPGAKIAAPAKVTLPSGQAELIRGTVPNGNGVSTGAELYLLEHGKRFYALSFKVNAELLSQAKVFRSIAENFRFV